LLIGATILAINQFLPRSPAQAASVFGGNVQRVGLQANLAAVGTFGASGGGRSNPTGGGEITIVGESALLPDAGPSGTAANLSDEPESDQISVYVVRPGDTLSEIAEMYGVSVNTILWANELGGAKTIQPGQTLVILPVTGVRHLVAKGETLATIAKKYRAEAAEIASFNNLTGNTLAVGTEIIIPDGDQTPSAPPPTRVATRQVKGADGPTYVGYYQRPIAGGVKTQGLHGYNGVDLASFRGAPIMAAAEGTVLVSKSAGWNGGYGKYIVIKHPNNTQTLYAHLDNNIVAVGQLVNQGQTIGYEGDTGNSTGVHLHFEVRGAKNPF